MPNSMIHLIVSKKVQPKGSTIFYIGNIAPDSVSDWHLKDITHFRNLKDREAALTKLAKKADGDFAEGILLHLYCDWKWDYSVRQDFMDKTGEEWFVPYRNELSLAGSHAFHHIEWAKQLWNDMYAIDIREYGAVDFASPEDVREFVSRNYKWHNETIASQSTAFTPDLINDFAEKTAIEYVKWRASL